MNEIIKKSEYKDWLRDLKEQIKIGQIKAALSVNSQMIMLYWDFGRQITEKQETAKWGSGFIEQLSKDLKEEFPEMTGFSYDNLLMMRRFYLFYQSAINQPSINIAQPVQHLEKNSDTNFAQVVQDLQIEDNQRNAISEQAIQQFLLVPWGHHTLLLRKVKDLDQALFYINKTIENNWSRAVLEYQN